MSDETVTLTPEQAKARSRRNVVIALAVGAFVVLVFFVSMARIHAGWIEEIFAEMPKQEKRELVQRLDALKAAMRATLSTSL